MNLFARGYQGHLPQQDKSTMCGIAGYMNLSHGPEEDLRLLERMAWPLRHRGPDGFGFFQDRTAGLAHARLSIIDLEGGWQPIHNEEKNIWVIFNGEIFNYQELRKELIARGHRFATNGDTEVIVHLYEEMGEGFVEELNGQFAIALYDAQKQAMLLVRDRMGIRPLFYTMQNGRLYFGSEIKAIFSANHDIPRSFSPGVHREIFTFWNPAGSSSMFMGVNQLEAGHLLKIDQNGLGTPRQYWDVDFDPLPLADVSVKDLEEELRALLIDSVRLRLRADVPVGAYLSGGLDSSSITALVKHYTDNPLKTFSVGFSDSVYDESSEQQQMVNHLQTDHHEVQCGYTTIAKAFPDVIYHTEVPILRTAPTPLYLLSALVRENDYKVVLTGEGADEILGGYDLFKEAKVRAFIGRQPGSDCRAMLLKQLYPYLALSPTKSASYAKQFFATDVDPDDQLFYGHLPRWKTGAYLSRFFTPAYMEGTTEPLDAMEEKFSHVLSGKDYFSRAQYVESKLLLGNYLLSSQGDRMGMANSVEGRYPFLDHRVVEFAAKVPVQLKMRGLNEKYLLKKTMADLLPASVTNRKKQPYMAPDILSFFGEDTPEYVLHYLSESCIRETGVFNADMVGKLVGKCQKKARQGFRENMALVGILSTQILYDKFIGNWSVETPDSLPNTKVLIK